MRTQRRAAVAELVALAIGGAAFAGYYFTLRPSVPGGDAGELIAVAARLGVAHPPGYPLWTMLGAVISKLPMGTVAWRLNLLSAICAAAAAAVLSATASRWSGRVAAGVVAGGLFAFSPLVWTYATGAEVFALNDLLVAALIYAGLRFAQSHALGWAYAGAALFGLGLSNHHTLIFVGAPLAVWAVVSGRSALLHPAVLVRLAACFGAGLLPYIYLPLAAAGDPPIAWGDPSTIQGFIHHLLRSDYGTLRLGGEIAAGTYFFPLLGLYARSLAGEALFVGLPLALAGIWASVDKSRARTQTYGFAWTLAVGFGIYVVGFHFAANLPLADLLLREVVARFWQQANIFVFLWTGLGFVAILSRCGPRVDRASLAMAVALVVCAFGLRVSRQNERENDFVARYARAILEPLPKGAVLLTRGDLITNGIRYVQLCEGERDDVTLVDQELLTRSWYLDALRRRHPELVFPGGRYHPYEPGGFTLRQWIDANAGRRPLWVYPDFKPEDPSVRAGIDLEPVGLPSRIVGPSVLDADEAIRRLAAREWPAAGRYGPGTWERVILEDVWQAWNRRAAWLLSRPEDQLAAAASARRLLEEAVRGHPAPPWHVFKNLGLSLERLRAGDPSLLAARDEAWHEYLKRAPADDPDRAVIQAAVGRD